MGEAREGREEPSRLALWDRGGGTRTGMSISEGTKVSLQMAVWPLGNLDMRMGGASWLATRLVWKEGSERACGAHNKFQQQANSCFQWKKSAELVVGSWVGGD